MCTNVDMDRFDVHWRLHLIALIMLLVDANYVRYIYSKTYRLISSMTEVGV